jgi:hypothetical protein
MLGRAKSKLVGRLLGKLNLEMSATLIGREKRFLSFCSLELLYSLW